MEKNDGNIMNSYKYRRELKETGITLIALVVTIIVLLILAGVTLSIALSNEGLIGRARNAKTTYLQAEQNDTNALTILEEKIGDYVEEETNFRFKINEETFSAEENMTWSQWVASEYNVGTTEGYQIIISNSDNMVYVSGGPEGEEISYPIFDPEGDDDAGTFFVKPGDSIIRNKEYQFGG